MKHQGLHPQRNGNDSRNGGSSAASADRHRALSPREREILDLLAEGLSGTEIAKRLVLSPETVRTHVRNAMAKLDASTRSQAVAIALRDQQGGGGKPGQHGAAIAERDPEASVSVALRRLVEDLVALYDLGAGVVYLADDDGLALRRAVSTAPSPELPEAVALGNGPLGRTALERRAQLVRGSGGGTLLAAPMQSDGKLLGVIALDARVSRPIGRTELLLLQALSNRIADVLAAGTDVDLHLTRAMKRFRSAWTSSRAALAN